MSALINIGYLISVILLIIGLRRLSSPSTARKGNLTAAIGMGLAILITMVVPLGKGNDNYLLIIIALAIGSVIGLIVSKRVEMTAMPELVSLFNGLGGACAVAISMIELYNYQLVGHDVMIGEHVTTLLAMFIGAIAFTGSMVAYGKLAGKISDWKVPMSGVVNIIFLVAVIVLIGFRVIAPDQSFVLPLIMLGLSLIYGITFVQPIGGADMPVVISLLNAFTGVSCSFGRDSVWQSGNAHRRDPGRFFRYDIDRFDV